MTDQTNTPTAAPTPTASTSGSNVLLSFVEGLGATLITDEEKVLQPVLDTYTSSLATDPSATNVAAQDLQFEASLVALGPVAGSTAIRDTATATKAFIDVKLPALAAAVSAELAANADAS
jgi:hypothetical protein